jgi:hypothetical protein
VGSSVIFLGGTSELKKWAQNVLTIFFGFIFLDHVSYTFTKFSDFYHFGFLKIFSDSAIIKR